MDPSTPPSHDPAEEPSRALLNVPNLLSLGRLAATPLLVWLIIADHRIVAIVLLGAMGFTDYLDGRIARATGQVTRLGIVLDPIGDRVLIMSTIVALMVARDLPLWLGIPVLLRDVALSATFMVLARRGYGRPKVRRVGKSATFALLSALPAVMIGSWIGTIGLVLFGFGGVLYYIAAYRYVSDVRDWMATTREPFA